MPRFVLLWHEVPKSFDKPSHWDLMLERDVDSTEGPSSEHQLATWNLFDLPTAWVALLSLTEPKGMPFPLETEQLADHRLHYLDHEGSVSKDRGIVSKVASGEIEWIFVGADRYEAQILAPSKLTGRLILTQAISSSVSGNKWLLNWSQ